MRARTTSRSGSRTSRRGALSGPVAALIALVVGLLVAGGLATGAGAAFAGTTTTVTVGGRTHVLDGINVERKSQYLVVYTRTSTQTVTPTNTWGAEVTVVGGVVTAVNDRWTSHAAPTPIPTGGFVLSGHDSARDWLLATARVGATVSIAGASLAGAGIGGTFAIAPIRPTTTTPTPTTPRPSSTPSTAAPSTTPSTTAQSTTAPLTTPSTTRATTAPSTTAPSTSAPSTTAPTSSTSRTSTAPASPTTTTTTASAPAGAARTWLSGAAGEGVGTGAFGTWRGTPVDIAGTWSDATATDQVELWGLQPGLEYGAWTGSADIAIGAIFTGETWAAAAQGAYDARWSQSLTQAKKLWTAKSRGTLYIRLAHEWNGNWTPWSVGAGDLANFRAAWQRFYQLKQSIFPAAKLVFCTNGDTVGQTYDWRTGWPGDAYVDVYATDWYSMHWTTWGATGVDRFGGPTGLEAHRQFALAHGKPFAVAEWGNNSDVGDQPAYIQYMRDFLTANGGDGAGKVRYEIYFNVIWSPNKFGLYPESSTLSPNAAARYRGTF